MKKFIVMLVVGMMFTSAAIASVNVMVDGKLYGPAQDLNFPAGTTITVAGPRMGFTLQTTGLVGAITSGTIDGAAIGGSSPAAGAFTTVAASGATDLATTLAVGTANAFTITAAGIVATTGAIDTESTLAVGSANQFTVSNAGSVVSVTEAISTGVGIGTTNVSAGLNVGTTSQFTVSAAGVIVDTAIYAATQGVGGNRTVCVSADGQFFSSAAACP